ncbi:hypothetical protein BH10PSE2_BH10PSE2_24490 [soil metagenome]
MARSRSVIASAQAARRKAERDVPPAPDQGDGGGRGTFRLAWPRWVAPGWIAGLALVLAIVLAPQIREGLGHPRSDIHAVRQSDAYNRLINDLVLKRGWLRLAVQPDGSYRVVASPLAPRDSRGWKAFVAASYLRVDMNAPTRWLYDDDLGTGARLVQIDPTAHQVLGPYAGSRLWRGDIQFRTGSSGGTGLRRAGGDAVLVFAPIGLTGNTAFASIPLFGPNAAVPAHQYRFVDQREIASVMALNDQEALVRVVGGSDVDVSVAGVQASAGPAEVQYLRLPAGRDLVFAKGDRIDRFTYQVATPTISRFEPLEGQRRRFAGLDSLARAIEPAVGLTGDRPVVSTLDQGLQVAAEADLDSIVAQLPATPVFRSAATLMDAHTGEVLAAASLPRPILADDGEGRSGQHRFTTRNHNFDLMPVGSVAKAPLAMAILQTFPALATLEIKPAAGGFRELLGVDLGSRRADGFAFSDTVTGPAWVGLTRFLEASSNKFAAALLLLALSETPTTEDPGLPPTPTDCYRIGGTERCRPPAMPILSGRPRGPFGIVPDMSQSTPAPWAGELTRLFGVRAEWDRTAPPRDMTVWTTTTRSGLNLASPALAALGLERESLGLNVIGDLKGDYLMSALGGGRSRWSTMRLAEIFSRMVLRRQVSAHLLVDEARPVPEALTIRNDVWAPMMLGLRAVAGPGGTGRELPTPIAPEGQEYRVFAKTGTPNVDRQQALSAVDLAMMSLAAYDCGLAWDGRERHLTLAGETAIAAARSAVKPVCRQVIDSAGAAAIGREMQRISRAGESGSGVAPPMLQTDRVTGRVVSITPDPDFDAEKGHAIALVVGRYRIGAPDDEPLRAMAIAINVQQRSDAIHNPATKTAAILLRDPVILAWLASPQPATSTMGQGN